jgi:hypothetical protein
VRLLIDVIEKRKRGRKYEDSDCGDRAKQQHQLSLMSHCKSKRGLHRGFGSITASFPYSPIT